MKSVLHPGAIMKSRQLQLVKEELIGVRLLTVPCSEGRGGSMDGYRHNMVTLISVGEVNVVETLHRL